MHAPALSPVQLFVTPWTVAHQAPLSMGFPRRKYWSGLQFPSPGDLSHPWIQPASPALAVGFFTTEPQGSPNFLEVTTNRKYFPPAITGNKPGVNTHLFALCLDAFLLVVVLVVKNHLPVKET